MKPDQKLFSEALMAHFREWHPASERELLILQKGFVLKPLVHKMDANQGIGGFHVMDDFSMEEFEGRLKAHLDPTRTWKFPKKSLQGTRFYAGILLAVFLFQQYWEIQHGSLIPEYGVSVASFISENPLKILSGTFLHAGWLHFIFNLSSLFFLGGFVERLLGPLRLFVVLLVSGWSGAVLSVTLHEPGMVSVGASGAIYGLLGALMVRLQGLDARYGKFVQFQASQLFQALKMLLLISLLLPVFVPRVDPWGHLGGLIAGMVVGALFRPQPLWRKSAIFALFVIGFTGLHVQADQKASQYVETLGRMDRDQAGFLKFANEKIGPAVTRLQMLLARPSQGETKTPDLPEAFAKPWEPEGMKERLALRRYIEIFQEGWALIGLSTQERLDRIPEWMKKFEEEDEKIMRVFGVKKEEGS